MQQVKKPISEWSDDCFKETVKFERRVSHLTKIHGPNYIKILNILSQLCQIQIRELINFPLEQATKATKGSAGISTLFL